MPPKPARGRGSTRARGTGRGGATASRATASASEMTDTTAPQSAEPTATSEDTAQPVTPKIENEEDAKPATPALTPAPDDAQQLTSIAPSATGTPQDATDSPARPPVQRLGSLNPSRSASPAIRRGVSTRGKRGTVKPTFSGRRSKEERESRDKELLERERERRKEQDEADRKKRWHAEKEAKRQATRAGRGRGGSSAAMSGPFSLGSSHADRKTNHRNTSGFGSGSGSRAARVRDEGEASGSGGGSGYRSTGGPSIKREDGGFMSSEDEDDAEFPRKDIDLIEISSDEDDAAPIERPQRSTLPVRIGRKEHQERTIGINTEASAEVGSKINTEHASAVRQASATTSRKHAAGKGKGKAPDFEVTSVKKPFKGVWQDAEESTSPIKTEQNSEDEGMADAEQIGIVNQAPQATTAHEPVPDPERRSKVRTKSIAEPILQTDEDRAEWARFQSNLTHIRAELGPDETPVVDGSGDSSMEGTGSNIKRPTVRDNNVYLFQIPPLMPELLPPTIKKEASEDQSQPVAPSPAASAKPEVKIKVEEGFSDPTAKGPEGPRFASGFVGKVRVRQSGRTTLDWGGTSYELTPGNKASFLQEVVSIQVVPEKDRVAPEDAGDAISFGRVKGKFVVVPDWNQMLG